MKPPVICLPVNMQGFHLDGIPLIHRIQFKVNVQFFNPRVYYALGSAIKVGKGDLSNGMYHLKIMIWKPLNSSGIPSILSFTKISEWKNLSTLLTQGLVSNKFLFPCVIADFTTHGESHFYGLPCPYADSLDPMDHFCSFYVS